MDEMIIRAVAGQFAIDGELTTFRKYGSGNINSTFTFSTDEGKKYILQRINTNVFSKPFVLMRNIESVTNYCRESIVKSGGDPERETLTIVKTKDGKNLFRIRGEYYRVYKFVTDCVVFDQLDNVGMFASAGTAFGRFAKLLDGYPIEELDETIPNFHNSKVRYRDFLKDIRRDPCGRVAECQEQIEKIKSRFFDLTRIVDYMEVGEIPVRVTHNDTKISNVLFDKDTKDALCVIDLDTVMPGSILFDFGDAIRSGASTEPEDGSNPEINLDYYWAFAENYLKETYGILKPMEIQNLAFSCRTITLELAMRFLDDYINGDTYFRCEFDDHNLIRAVNQLRLLESMEEHFSDMEWMISKLIKELQ
ncbi:aminoglycoside phosphotransferase family protein [Candidatus Saccharibacteria bacterium]|nr:aminoglycoside phosphotransferase family protein [Candidatus Saccharibacteria bacterium]